MLRVTFYGFRKKEEKENINGRSFLWERHAIDQLCTTGFLIKTSLDVHAEVQIMPQPEKFNN